MNALSAHFRLSLALVGGLLLVTGASGLITGCTNVTVRTWGGEGSGRNGEGPYFGARLSGSFGGSAAPKPVTESDLKKIDSMK